MAAPRLEPVVLSDDERDLRALGATPEERPGVALRCRIVLACADGGHDIEVAERSGVDRGTRWASGARDFSPIVSRASTTSRAGCTTRHSDDDVEALIVKTLKETPDDATHWSTRSMAKATGMSQSAVSRIWRAFGLKPHLVETFKLSPDPHFVDKVRDIVGLYVNPPEAPSCSASTRRPRSRRSIAPLRSSLAPGLPERRTHDYVRGGHDQPLCGARRGLGQVIADMTERHRAEESRRYLNLINRSVPEDLDVHLVVDNVSTHKTPEIKRWLLRHPRFTSALHPDLQLVDQPRRALVRRADHQVATARHPPLDQRARGRDHRLDRPLEQGPQAIRLAQERRRDPRHTRRLLRADLRLRSVGDRSQRSARRARSLPALGPHKSMVTGAIQSPSGVGETLSCRS